MKDKFFLLSDLAETGVKMVMESTASHTKIGEPYLQPSVINKWDFSDYSKFYTYYDNAINHVVLICHKVEGKRIVSVPLLKDLSNLPKKQHNEVTNDL